MRHTDAAPIDTLTLRCVLVGRDRLDLPEADDTIATIRLNAEGREAMIVIAGTLARRYLLRLHLDGLDLAVTYTADMLEVGTPVLRGGAITMRW